MPMLDRRELILDRLLVIANANKTVVTPNIRQCFRNRDQLVSGKGLLPALLILDGDETPGLPNGDVAPPRRYGRGGASPIAPMAFSLKPQIYFLTEPPALNAIELGARANAIRIALVEAVLNDGTIRYAVGANGTVAYRGAQTDLRDGGQMQGRVRLDFEFGYFLNPGD